MVTLSAAPSFAPAWVRAMALALGNALPDPLDEAFCECVARIGCVRVGLLIKSGTLYSLVGDDPPEREECAATCRACDAQLLGRDCGRLLCARCRSSTTVEHGAPLIDTMYRSANPKFVLSPEMEAIAASIVRQRKVALQEHMLARHLAHRAYVVYERWKGGSGDMNAHYTLAEVECYDCSYARAVTSCNRKYFAAEDLAAEEKRAKCKHAPMPRHLAVTVGGLGLRLQQEVKQRVVDWLYCLDEMIRRRFEISLARPYGDTSLLRAINHFAELIANRVVLLEEPVDDDTTERVCTEGFEHAAEIEEVRCKREAARVASSDVRRMRELKALAGERAVPEDPRRLIDFLRAPCPELLKALPGVHVASAMRFDDLRRVLEEACDVPRRINLWAQSVNAGALCVLLDGAIQKAQEWKMSRFLHCLRYDAAPLREPLPEQTWVDEPRIALWSLVSKEAHAHRRTGFDPVGLRIVLMSSALIQINSDGGFFRPGVLRCDVVSPVAHNHQHRSAHYCHALSEQLLPYMTGEPWKFARTELTKWQGSHMESDVRGAVSLLGRFSVQEVVARYGRAGPQLEIHSNLVRRAVEMMVFKPPAHYEQWFPMAVELVLPILAQLRQSMGIATDLWVKREREGTELLPLMDLVRAWSPTNGDLRIRLSEVKDSRIRAVLTELLARRSPLVRQKKVNRVMCWILDQVELVKVLGK